MKILSKLMFVSVATAGLVFAHPMMKGDSPEVLKAPRGIIQELYDNASIQQKRELLQIDFDARKAEKAQTEKFRQYRDMVKFDIQNLRLDLEEANANRNSSKAMDILSKLAKKESDIRKSKQDEQNLRYILQEDRIKKMNAVLRVK